MSLRERRDAVVREHMESENRHDFELTLTTFSHPRYELGTGFGHLAIGVDDIYAACATMRTKGAKIVREPGPMKHGGSEIAFIEDPDGYRIELIQLRGRID